MHDSYLAELLWLARVLCSHREECCCGAAAEQPAAITTVFPQLKAGTPLSYGEVYATALSTTQSGKYFTIKRPGVNKCRDSVDRNCVRNGNRKVELKKKHSEKIKT